MRELNKQNKALLAKKSNESSSLLDANYRFQGYQLFREQPYPNKSYKIKDISPFYIKPEDLTEERLLLISPYLRIKTFNPDITSFENQQNLSRLKEYETKFSDIIIQLIVNSNFEYGFDTPLDIFLKERLAENSSVTKEWLNLIFINNFSNVPIITGILRTIAHFNYSELSPNGVSMSIAALSHENSEVKECAIRTFENWVNPESLKILKSVKIHEAWLNDYLQQVISDLEGELK